MTSEEIAPGWVLVSLGELLISIEAGKSFKCDERPPKHDETGVVKVSAVTWGEYQEEESKTCTDAQYINPALFVQPGDFLFSRANTIDLVGACVIAKKVSLRVMLSDKILRLRFVNDAMKPWLLNFLRSWQGRTQIEALASGNQDSMRNIGQERIGQILLPLPPSAENDRVVAKLEELLSDLDAGVAELKAAQKKLTQYRQSLLKAAVEGALTAEWRKHNKPKETGAQLLERILKERHARWEEKQLARFKMQGKAPPKDWQKMYLEPAGPDVTGSAELPENWTWGSVGQLSFLDSGEAFKKSDYSDDGIRLLQIANVSFGKTLWEQRNYLPARFMESHAELQLGANEIVIALNRPLIGNRLKIAAIRGDDLPSILYQRVGRLRLVQPLSSDFLLLLLQSPNAINQIRERLQGTDQPYLNTSLLPEIRLPLPPLDEQDELLEIVKNGLQQCDAQEVAIEHALKQSAAQRKNILKAAFSGQLVPQDPNDEPASVLLERIRAERLAKAQSTTKRAVRKRA